MNIPTISVNFGYFLELGSLPMPQMMWRLFLDGGWILVLIVLFEGSKMLWLQWRQNKFGAGIKTTTLAIDVPRMNEQTPKAVEQIFAQLSGAYSGPDFYEKWWLGKFQATFSLEVVSMEGYVQFLVHTWTKYRDLVEAAFYSQYPDAEITEVQDYTRAIPSHYPDPDYDVWGTEFVLKKPFALPIRTYPQFEHTASEEYFKDPLTPLLEIFSSIRRNEFLWLQILIVPGSDSWKAECKAQADKILGKKPPVKKTVVDQIIESPQWILTETHSQIFGAGAPAKPEAKKDDGMKMMNLTPVERNVLEAVQMKATKIGFATKMRLIYAGKRGVFNKGRISQVKGALGLFADQEMNGFRPYGPVTPKEDYFYERWEAPGKKNKVLRHYRGRSGRGATPYFLNVEELASIYHFPFRQSKAPMIQKTEAKRSEPPARLPVAEENRVARPFQPIVKNAPPPPPPPPEDDDDEE